MIDLYCLGNKGLIGLTNLDEKHLKNITQVVIGTDENVAYDYSEDIISFCKNKKLNYTVANKTVESQAAYIIAIGWRWIIETKNTTKLIVFHDSLLPEYRGFNPLVSYLINGENEIGVSVLEGSEDYDCGGIYLQEKIKIMYPIKIENAIEKISILYGSALRKIIEMIGNSEILRSAPQDDNKATYSLWRDDKDYKINWNESSTYIQRFIDSVGFPYKGAFTTLNGNKLIIKNAQISCDKTIVNRQPGKVIFKKKDVFYIVCGDGILEINEFFNESGEKIELKNFRYQFN